MQSEPPLVHPIHFYIGLAWTGFYLVGLVFCFAGAVRKPLVGFLSVVGLLFIVSSQIIAYDVLKVAMPEKFYFLMEFIGPFLGQFGLLLLLLALPAGLMRPIESKPINERYELSREAYLRGWPVRLWTARMLFYFCLLGNGLVGLALFESLGTITELTIAIVSLLLTILSTAIIVESHRFLRGPKFATFILYLILFAPGGMLAGFVGLMFAANKVKKQFAGGADKLLIQS